MKSGATSFLTVPCSSKGGVCSAFQPFSSGSQNESQLCPTAAFSETGGLLPSSLTAGIGPWACGAEAQLLKVTAAGFEEVRRHVVVWLGLKMASRSQVQIDCLESETSRWFSSIHRNTDTICTVGLEYQGPSAYYSY